MEFIDLKEQYSLQKNEINGAIQKVLDHGKYILGPEVEELEEALSSHVGVKHCISVANGTDAIQIALMALGIDSGSEVITPGFTYIATAEAAAVLGARPVYADVEYDSCNLDHNGVEGIITKRTRAIIPVSLYGQTCDFDEINKIARTHKIPVIEDAAQSFGAKYKLKNSCALSDIACTSFFPTKPLGCYGDGGAIFTNNDEYAKIIRQIARHGQEKRYHHVRVGVNSRLDSIQAAILLVKLRYIDKEMDLRNEAAEYYVSLLNGVSGVDLPVINSFNFSAWGQFTVKIKNNRDAVSKSMNKMGVPTAVHYPLPLHRQPAVYDGKCNLPVSEKLAQEVLSIPISPYINRSDQRKVVDALIESVSLVGRGC